MRIIKTFLQTFKPSEYDEITDHSVKQTCLYFLKIVSVSFFILCILAIPLLLSVRDAIENRMNGFEKLVVTTEFKQTQPIHIGAWATIDLQANKTAEDKAVFITQQTITLKKLFFEKTIQMNGLSDITAHKKEYAITVFTIFLLMLPSLLLIAYVWYVIKFMIIILLVSLITFIIVRVTRFELSFKIIFNSALFASSVAILIELATRPLSIDIAPMRIEWVGYAISFILFMIAIREQGYWDKKLGVKPRKKGYVAYG